ncbi:MAG: ferrous iron transport protein A [Spirochaetales bacterium]|nr:ferrous iron transport protein A [Spirochaetales bacterium]
MELAALKQGEKGIFVGINGGGHGIINKLASMGIRPGVLIIKKSNPFFHGPVVIEVGRTQLAIGFGMARKMLVDPVLEK